MPPFPLNFLGFKLNDLEDQAYKNAALLQDQIAAVPSAADPASTAAERQRAADAVRDRNRQVIEQQNRLKDLARKLTSKETAQLPEQFKALVVQVNDARRALQEAEQSLAPEARLKSLAAQVKLAQKDLAEAEQQRLPAAVLKSFAALVDDAQQRYVQEAATPGSPRDPTTSFRAEPQIRLAQLRELDGKIRTLQAQLDQLPKQPQTPEQRQLAARRPQLERLLASFQSQKELLQTAAPREAARPQVRTAQSPGSQLQSEAAGVRQEIGQSLLEGKTPGQLEDKRGQLNQTLARIARAAGQMPRSIETRLPNGQIPSRGDAELARRLSEIMDLDKQIKSAQANPKESYKVERLQTQLLLLQEALAGYKARKAVDPHLAAPASVYDASREIQLLQTALDQLGVGYDLVNDPQRMEQATRLRAQLDRLKASLPDDALVRTEEGGYGAELRGARSGAPGQTAASRRQISDVKLRELLERFYGDTSEFKGFQITDRTLQHPEQRREVIPSLVPDLAQEIAAEFLPFLPNDTALPRAQRQKLEQLKMQANNFLSQAWSLEEQQSGGRPPEPQKVFDLARAAFESFMLTSQDGICAVLRDVRMLMNQARHEGTVTPKQYDKYEQYLRNTSAKDLMDQTEKYAATSDFLSQNTQSTQPPAAAAAGSDAQLSQVAAAIEAQVQETGVRYQKEDAVQDLFSTVLQYANQQIALEQKPKPTDMLKRLMGARAAVAPKMNPQGGGR